MYWKQDLINVAIVIVIVIRMKRREKKVFGLQIITGYIFSLAFLVWFYSEKKYMFVVIFVNLKPPFTFYLDIFY